MELFLNLSYKPFNMMSFEKILLYFAMPYFTISMLIELIYARWKGDNIPIIDTVSSLSSGMTNILKGSLGLGLAIITYDFMLGHLALFHWRSTPVWMYLVCFIGIDFAGYWTHRIEHKVNFFWNRHIIHHSSEEFNLACALRQSFSDFVEYFTIFSLPMALLGIPTMVIGIIAPIQLFMQFWYHTRYIGRLGWLEHILITPSQHRVHHAMNDIYMDKNFGQGLAIWDRIFGPYQPELVEVEPVYGVKRPVRTWNPFIINFKHLYLIITDAWRTQSYSDKLRVWYMPTGWRPADVAEKYPVDYVSDFSTFEKFAPSYSTAFQTWAFLQMLFSLLMMGFLFYRIDKISHTETLIYGGFLLVSIFAYTAVMDKKIYGVVAMIVQVALGIALIIQTGDWFGMAHIWSSAPLILIGFWVISVAACVFFMLREFGMSHTAQAVESEA